MLYVAVISYKYIFACRTNYCGNKDVSYIQVHLQIQGVPKLSDHTFGNGFKLNNKEL